MNAIGPAQAAARSQPRERLAGLSAGRLAWLQATQRRGVAACLGLCMAVTVLLPSLLPLLDDYAAERAVADTLAGQGGFAVEQEVTNVDQFGSFRHDVENRVERRLPGVLMPLTAYAAAGPLHAAALNGDPVPAQLAGRAFQATYLDGLAGHVQLRAGELPPDGLGGGETAVTISQASANLTGLNLSDRICLTYGGQPGSMWCARIVGLWQPLDERDPFWGGRAPLLELAMGRYDLFQLAQVQLAAGARAGLRYWAGPDAVDAARALPLAESVRGLAAELRTSGRRVLTQLDSALLRVSEQHRLAAASLRVFIAALALLGLVVVAVTAHRFLGEQHRLLAVLRARGWPRRRTWLQAVAGLLTPALYGLPLALGTCLVVLALAAPVSSPAGPAALGSAGGRSALYLSCGLAALVLTLLAVIAASAVWRELPASLEPAFRPRRDGRRLLVGALAVLGIAGLLGLRLPSRTGPVSEPSALILAGLPVLGILSLGLLAGLLPAGARFGDDRSVAWLLAGRQLQRAPAQYAGTTVALVLAAAATAVAVLVALWEGGNGSALGPVQRSGSEAILGLGSLGVLALLVVATALDGRWIARRRQEEYRGLLDHGLSRDEVRRSLTLEQLLVSVPALLAGGLLGAVLAFSLQAPWPPTPSLLAASLAALLGSVLFLLGAALTAGRLARHRELRPAFARGLER